MNKIPFGVRGKVLNGTHPNMMIRVEDDAKNTGGFLIYQWWDGSNGPNEHGAFDDWFESRTALEQYFVEADWSIEWEQK